MCANVIEHINERFQQAMKMLQSGNSQEQMEAEKVIGVLIEGRATCSLALLAVGG